MPSEKNAAPSDINSSEDHRHKSRARLVWIAVSGSTNGALLTSIIPLFMLSLGASPFMIGLVATSTHVQKIGRVAGLHYMHRIGKTGLFLWGRMGSAPFGLGLAALAYGSGHIGWAAVLALLLFSVRGTLQQVGNTAWWPLVQDHTEGGSIGSYLAHMRLRQRLLELVLPIGVGWYQALIRPAAILHCPSYSPSSPHCWAPHLCVALARTHRIHPQRAWPNDCGKWHERAPCAATASSPSPGWAFFRQRSRCGSSP